MPTKIPSSAYHEAGHAVAAVIVGLHVTIASIEKKGYPPGWPLHGGVIAGLDHSIPQNRNEAERLVTAGLAGEQAERVWSSRKPWRRPKNSRHFSFSGDRAYVQDILGPIVKNSDDKQRTIKRLRALSRDLLEKNWSSVEALAERLAARQVVYGPEIMRLVASKRKSAVKGRRTIPKIATSAGLRRSR